MCTKICSKCKEEKPLDAFSPAKKNEDGTVKYYNSWCNKCRTKNNRERLGLEERPIPIINENSKECLECHNVLPLENFSPSSRGRLGVSSYCKSCANKRFKPTPEKVRQASATYRAKHSERWRAAHRVHQFNRKALIKATNDGTVTDEVLKNLLNKETCCWCNNPVPKEFRTIEHIIELSNGGTHSASNLDMACLSCNSARVNKHNNKIPNTNKDIPNE